MRYYGSNIGQRGRIASDADCIGWNFARGNRWSYWNLRMDTTYRYYTMAGREQIKLRQRGRSDRSEIITIWIILRVAFHWCEPTMRRRICVQETARGR